MQKGKTYRVCSTCINFSINRTEAGNEFRCVRLDYETKPHYSFNCWDPKPEVKALMRRLEREEDE